MSFNIDNLQFVTKEDYLNQKVEVLPGKTLRVVCCDRTKSCLELLAPYKPDEKEFLFFEHTFSKPHIFRKIGTVPQIAVRPEILDRFFKMVEEKALEISLADLREAFFKCLEIDLTLDIHQTTTGIASYPILKFIDRLKEAKAAALAELTTEILEPEYTLPNSDFTTARQVLALYYLTEQAGLKMVEVNKTDLARFTQFLTGKEAGNTQIENTNIYKRWKDIFAGSSRKNHQDLQYIKAYFERLGLHLIVTKIQNDIDNA